MAGGRGVVLRMSDRDEDSEASEPPRFGRADGEDRALETLAWSAAATLVESDVRRGEYGTNSDGSSSQGRWLHDPAGRRLGGVLGRLAAVS